MPDEKTETKLEQLANNADNNTKVAAALLEQDQSNRLSTPADLVHTADALDKLATEKTEEKTKEKTEEAAPPVVEKKKVDAPAASTPPPAPEPVPDPVAEENKKRADELFKDSPALPPNASPKSGEAFTAVKIRAAQEISARESEIEKLKKENADLAAKLKDPIPPETLKELEDHRNWRAKLDVETDPKFKEFDKTVSAAQEFIYAQLRKSPAVTDEIITKIKSHGGPENVQLEKIFEAMKDPTIQRLVEAKVADIEMAKFGKQQAINSAKENIGQYLTERQKQWEESAKSHNKATQQELDGFKSSHLSWLSERQPDPKASDPAANKAEVEAHNKFVKEVQDHLQSTLEDDSPKMRAIMMMGMAQLLYAQRVIPVLKASVETEKTAHEATKKLLTEANEKLEKIKKGSRSRLEESAAPPGGKLPPVKTDIDTRPAAQALDEIAKQVMEERRRTQNIG